MAQTKSTAVVKNIVIVHGGLVDGSGWEGVYNILKKDGYTVVIVQIPTISLADDVAFTKRAIAVQNGAVILVGHSYGGAVITEAGNDPKVAGRGIPILFAGVSFIHGNLQGKTTGHLEWIQEYHSPSAFVWRAY